MFSFFIGFQTSWWTKPAFAWLQIPPPNGRGLHVLHSPLDSGFYLLWLESNLRCIVGALVSRLYGGLLFLDDSCFDKGETNFRLARSSQDSLSYVNRCPRKGKTWLNEYRMKIFSEARITLKIFCVKYVAKKCLGIHQWLSTNYHSFVIPHWHSNPAWHDKLHTIVFL